MRDFWFVFLFSVGIGAGFGGCAVSQNPSEETIYVSILPLRTLVHDIVGDDFPIEVLVPPGASPETFEPTARQFAALNDARLIFNVGLIDFEQTLLAKVYEQDKIVNLSKDIALIAGNCSCSNGAHGTSCGGHAHPHGVDPHVWTSPKALRQMAVNAYEAIHRLYPDSVKYTENYVQLSSRLDDLDKQVHDRITKSSVRSFMIYHPAMTYYARDYDIRQIAVEQEGKEPSAKRLAALIRQAREEGIGRVLYQRQFPRSTVEAIARDMEAEPAEIDPLREDIIDNILTITDLITRDR